MLKSIAIMTSGGDSPGMNAVARAVVRTALYEGVKVFGIYDGYKGMLEDRIVELNSQSVSDIIQRGGTFLGTARCPEFKQEETRKEAYIKYEYHQGYQTDHDRIAHTVDQQRPQQAGKRDLVIFGYHPATPDFTDTW